MRRKVVWTPREAHRRQGNYYGHQRGEEFVLGQEGLVYASLPGIHPIRPRVLPSFPIVHVSCSPEGRHLPSVCPHIKCQVARPPRWCVHCTAGRWCRPWWCSRGFPDSKFVFGKGNLPADGEDQGICGHHVCVSEHREDDSSDQDPSSGEGWLCSRRPTLEQRIEPPEVRRGSGRRRNMKDEISTARDAITH